MAKHVFRLDARSEVDDVEFYEECAGPACSVCLNGWCKYEPDYDWLALRDQECPGSI